MEELINQARQKTCHKLISRCDRASLEPLDGAFDWSAFVYICLISAQGVSLSVCQTDHGFSMDQLNGDHDAQSRSPPSPEASGSTDVSMETGRSSQPRPGSSSPQNLEFHMRSRFQMYAGFHMRPGFQMYPGLQMRPGFQMYPGLQMRPGFQMYPGFQMRPGFQMYPGFQMRPGFQMYPGLQMRPGFQMYPGLQMRPGFQKRRGFWMQKHTTFVAVCLLAGVLGSIVINA
ncbi:uncharacterized protein LOC114427757 [Parambassis ranga]|uniref:Uncharacterized protein LOC114427757 n=1 Tax=Parambassis ranga TaxID=210632 RepID=A0A6P7HT40_9TELE|nr:uncharacterized protein LOC114427757 [Parambassis ranga]